MLLGETIHELSSFFVGPLFGCSLVIFAPPEFNTNHHYSTGHSTADFFFASHASPKSTSYF